MPDSFDEAFPGGFEECVATLGNEPSIDDAEALCGWLQEHGFDAIAEASPDSILAGLEVEFVSVVDELRDMMDSVTNIRNRAIIGLQFKLGLRAGEVSNIKISNLSLPNSEIQGHYSEMGTARRIADRENVIYVPSGDERDGNKSRRPRVLPLDDELRRVLTRYLLIRPDSGERWLFLSEKTHSELNKSFVNKVWKDEFHPEYAETDEYRPVTSHFGRHRFSTWWRVEQDVNRELVKYMRGDKPGSASAKTREAIDAYLHTYYEDIRDLYLENIYKIGLQRSPSTRLILGSVQVKIDMPGERLC